MKDIKSLSPGSGSIENVYNALNGRSEDFSEAAATLRALKNIENNKELNDAVRKEDKE